MIIEKTHKIHASGRRFITEPKNPTTNKPGFLNIARWKSIINILCKHKEVILIIQIYIYIYINKLTIFCIIISYKRNTYQISKNPKQNTIKIPFFLQIPIFSIVFSSAKQFQHTKHNTKTWNLMYYRFTEPHIVTDYEKLNW